MTTKTSGFDRVLLTVAPQWALTRIRARAAAATLMRHYEAATPGRRTVNYPRSGADANKAVAPALSVLRAIARDLVRNNAWARRGQRVIGSNVVGWGIVPKAAGAKAGDLWRMWGETTACDADGRLTFYGLQRQIMETVAEAGEILVRRRSRRPEDGLPIPLQLQLLEPDYIDTAKDSEKGSAGGPIINGIEFDAVGRRAAYWLFPEHPGSARLASPSRRIPATEILHVFRQERPSQARGVSWFAPVIMTLREFDEYEDATLMRQKIASLFAGFVTDVDGTGAPLGEQATDGSGVETLEPGLMQRLAPGQSVTFASPPQTNEHGSFSTSTLRRIAAGLGVTYEDLTGDYSQVNFSSARMGRLSHWANVEDWRWNMLVPQFCDPAMRWAFEAAELAGGIAAVPEVTWTPPPMPMIDPEKEGLALARLVRSGAKTPSEVVREQGHDPGEFWKEYAADLERLDELGIALDSDARRLTQGGQAQSRDPLGEWPDPAPPPTNGAGRPPEMAGEDEGEDDAQTTQ